MVQTQTRSGRQSGQKKAWRYVKRRTAAVLDPIDQISKFVNAKNIGIHLQANKQV